MESGKICCRTSKNKDDQKWADEHETNTHQINENSIYVIKIMAFPLWLSPQILNWIRPGGTGRGQDTACVMDMTIARAYSTWVQPKNNVTPASIWCCHVVGGFFIASHAIAWDTQLIAKTKNIQQRPLLDWMQYHVFERTRTLAENKNVFVSSF